MALFPRSRPRKSGIPPIITDFNKFVELCSPVVGGFYFSGQGPSFEESFEEILEINGEEFISASWKGTADDAKEKYRFLDAMHLSLAGRGRMGYSLHNVWQTGFGQHVIKKVGDDRIAYLEIHLRSTADDPREPWKMGKVAEVDKRYFLHVDLVDVVTTFTEIKTIEQYKSLPKEEGPVRIPAQRIMDYTI